MREVSSLTKGLLAFQEGLRALELLILKCVKLFLKLKMLIIRNLRV
jgi:hypothetical protein